MKFLNVTTLCNTAWLLFVHTHSSEQAHNQQDDDTPEHIHVHLPLQLAALVTRAVVVEHGFGLMTCRDARRVGHRSETEWGQSTPVMLTRVNDYSHSFLRVADGTASKEEVFFVKCVSSAAASVDSDGVEKP